MAADQITILIADDEAPIRGLLQKILQNSGYQVLIAADGKQAFEIAETHNGLIDLLLSDIVMPEMSGLKLARAITAKCPETKIILTSSFAPNIREMDRGWTFLAKPYNASLLLDTIHRVLTQRLGLGSADGGIKEQAA